MRKLIHSTETIMTAIEPERLTRLADESMLAVRLIEERKATGKWIFEYEVSGEIGNVEKFLVRMKKMEATE